MIRAIGIFGFAGLFAAISPDLRQMAADAALQGATYLNVYSPFSYVGLGVLVAGVMMLLAKSAVAPR